MVLLYVIVTSVVYSLFSHCSFSITLGLGLSLFIVLDQSSLFFLLTLLSVSFTVLLWSYYYIESEAVYRQFYCTVLFFLGSIF